MLKNLNYSLVVLFCFLFSKITFGEGDGVEPLVDNKKVSICEISEAGHIKYLLSEIYMVKAEEIKKRFKQLQKLSETSSNVLVFLESTLEELDSKSQHGKEIAPILLYEISNLKNTKKHIENLLQSLEKNEIAFREKAKKIQKVAITIEKSLSSKLDLLSEEAKIHYEQLTEGVKHSTNSADLEVRRLEIQKSKAHKNMIGSLKNISEEEIISHESN